MTIKINISYDEHLQNGTKPHCDCCAREHMNRTFKLISPDFGKINLGVVCAGRWFQVNLTGNKHTAMTRLIDRIMEMEPEERKRVIELIQQSARALEGTIDFGESELFR